MLVGNYGPGGQDAIRAELMRRLMDKLHESAQRTLWATYAIGFLTAVLVVLTIVLIATA